MYIKQSAAIENCHKPAFLTLTDPRHGGPDPNPNRNPNPSRATT